MKDWKVKFYLTGCDDMHGHGLDDDYNTDVDIPFIPRKGEVVWLPRRSYNELDCFVAKCWEEEKCKDCPFMYHNRKSVDDIDTRDCIYVYDIIYDAENKEVMIALSDYEHKEEL